MILTKDKRSKYKILAIVAFIVAVGFFYGGFVQGLSYSKENVKLISGTLNSYSFNDMGRQRYDYILHLNETNKSFQITATLVDYFNKDRFINAINRNDSIDLVYIDKTGFVFTDRSILLAIHSKKMTFLDFDDSMDKLKNESTFCKYISLISLILGIIILVVLNKSKS